MIMSHIRNFVLLTTEHFFNRSNLSFNEKAEEALSDFVHHSQTLILQSLVSDNTLILHTKIQFDQKKSIIFYKSNASELHSEESINLINLVTVTNNAAESLYQIVKQIYSPLLANDNDLLSNNIQKNLSDLESNLRIITHGTTNENINVIFTIEDEANYWKTVGEKDGANKKEKESASAYYNLFQDICEEIRSMQASTLPEVRESTENIGGILDDVWRLTTVVYSEERMMHMFNIIGHTICSTIQKSIPLSDLWQVNEKSKDNVILLLLSDGLSVIHTWISACKSLTETYWPNYALHTWNGKPFIPHVCIDFEKRLKEIYEIKSTYCQLNKLLTNNEREELKIRNLFEPFENINVWIYSGTNQPWEAAVPRFSSNLRPAETKIAEKLKPRLHNTSTKQMLYEFMRYKALINRPLVKQALNNELEIFVSSLISMLKSIKSQLDSDELDVQMYQPPEMTPVVQQVQWAKQMEAKVKDIRTCAEKYLSDFEGSSELLKLSDQLLKDLKSMYTQLHEDWSRELLAQVNSGSLQLRLEKPVVEFSGTSKMLEVQYEARAVRCEREARALKALGLPPPPAAAAALHALTDALSQAQRLQQVASFHNTLGSRMIPSTRAMMLQAALDLSALVQNQQPVYWDDAAQLAAYTDRLMRAVLKLESQNTYLTNQHVAIRAIVEKLMDTELLAQQAEWKKNVKDIRDIIEKVEANGYKNTESWRLHWDWQIYKVMECQYIKTLLSLHKHFPHVKVDLVLRGGTVGLQPPLEQVRAQHYHQLRRLVALPAHLPNLRVDTSAAAICADIVQKHSWLGNKAVQQVEAALSALERTCTSWTRRAALACVDLEALCAEHLKEPADWEANFKACKAYGQAVAKMTFEDEKIEWITVGTVTLRREFEAQTRSFWACLMSSLQSSCRADALALDAFIASASVMLENKAMPKNAKDLAEISAKQQALQKNIPEMEKTVENLKRKGHMLRTWGGDSTTEGVIKEWQRVREMMLSQQQLFEHQAEIVKSSLSGEWENLNSSVEAWASRWSQNKGRLEETHGVQYSEMADRCRSVFVAQTQWEKFVTDRDELMKECQKFNLELQPSGEWEEAEKLMKEYSNVWTSLKEFNEEFESIIEQDWIVFQKKLHVLDEFVSKWAGKLEPYTVVTLYLQQELEKYTDLTTLLKYLRGTDFTERHWREVFGLLEMEYKKPDSLQVKDLLAVAVNIKKQIKLLQKICTTASSEAAVRNALNELELWFAGARLNITYYTDKAKRSIPIVKDFKDILSKIEEQQWVVSSVSGGGGDACAAWESRLRAARACVRAAAHAQRRSMLYEFMRYKALINRPLVKQALNNELEIFVSSLISMLKSIKSQLDSDELDVQMYQPPEMTPVVQQVQWAKQMEAKVKDIRTCAEKYLSDFEGSSELLKLSDQLLKDLKSMYTQLHEDWSRELLAQVNSGSLQLRLEKPVVEFSGTSKMLEVQYEARAVRCEREARALKALGLPPPPAAAAALHALTDALSQAQRLQQVASFHNTLGSRMIPSTRAMMLQAALDLSALVQNQQPVYWDDAAQLAAYTDRLMRAVLKLESQNTYLTNQHVAIRAIVEKLMDTELLAQQAEWKKNVKDIRDIIEKVEANGYKNTESWRLHWDWQIYKVMECQYIKTLLSLHKHFPHVKVDLVLRGGTVGLQPPLEQVRAQHYHQLRRLVALPAHLPNLRVDTSAAAICADIVQKHSWLGNKAVQQVEAALSALERTCTSWTRRAALACVDLEALCAEHLKEPADWEANFKACKAYGQAVAKMTFEDEKIEWITVGTVTLRREFEAQTRSFWACLMSSLQSSCRADALALDAFIASASVMLENKAMPKNAKDLAEISAKQQALQKNIPEMEKTVENLKRKGHMLRTWGGDSTTEGVIKEWQRVREMMLSQQQLFEHQAEIVKSSLSGEWENLNSSVEAWASRWSQNKGRLEETHGVQYSEMADRCRSVFVAQTQWEKFVTDRDELMKECQKFNLELQPSGEWEEAEKLMKEYSNVWTSLKEFNEEFESIIEQDWIVFQKKLHVLDEFVSKWAGKLEPYTVVTLYLQQELEKYTDLTTLLKYLRGTDFTERHWREVFGLLEMEYKKPDSLQVKDLLAVAVNIKKQIKLLQKICTTASSEAAVRNALNELELWFAGARLNITYYTDKAKRSIPIVKDFKDILSKIEEQQWVVSSVSGGGGDACAAWESRLRAARACVRAAAHAQRRATGRHEGGPGAERRRRESGGLRAGQCSERRAETPHRGMALRALLIVWALIAGADAVYSRERDRLRADPRLLDRACELSSCYPATGNLLIGRESRLFASSTCGLNGPERYCIVSHLEDRKKCFWCETTNSTKHNPILNHRIQNIIYKFYPGTRNKSWWQSENGKEKVSIELDMEAEFHLTHLIIKFKTFRPAAMLVERSFDFGKTWRVYRYFAYNCDESFPGIPKHSQRSLTEVVCESRYSGVAPSTEGDVIFRVLPANINVTNPYSEEVQNLLRMTNLRINFTKLHTLGDDHLDNRAEIQEKYYYSIYEMTVRGSCSCYGHASRCLPMPGVESKNNMVHGRCECTHNTRGLNCEYCEDFYNDLPWQPAVGKTSNACKRCTCNNHATTCHFDPAVYNKTGKISGGVCDNCQHNTIGLNCERCKPKYFKDPNLDIQSPDICKQCDCDPDGTTDKEVLCDDETDPAYNKTAGRCLCKPNVDGARCDRCRDGYWNFDPSDPNGCISCTCNSLGTINERGCDQLTGNCFCKRHVTGRNCDQCLPEFYGLSDTDDGCLPCDCDVGGSIDKDCDVITGQCKCRPNVTGRRCDQPIQNFFVGALDSIVIEGESSQCDSQIDDNAIQSQVCHVVIRENFPEGKETWTGPGFMKIPEGSTLVFVVNNLKNSMNYNVLIRYEPQSPLNWEEATILVKRPLPIDSDSPCANVRPEDDTVYTSLPANQRSVLVQPAVCLEKEKETEIRIYLGRQDGHTSNSRASVLIDSIVLIPSFEDLPFFANGSSMKEEFDRYDCGNAYYYSLNRDTVPEICKKYHASIGFYIRNGTESCQCDPSGSKSHQCNPYTGYCQCVENIVGPRCDRCAPGTYGFSKFGCKRCDCNSIGSLDNFCDATSGQCRCRANTYGRACDLCQPGYFNFPNCQQCECNGHAVECDDKTGACKECTDYTEGHRCERCIDGYYGDPRLGVDIPCRPCPCPGVIGDANKNSHADRCELDPDTKDVVCDCKEGYAGLLCDVCADNYYGDPIRGTCEKCECNDNIDITKPGNCDPYTGKCLQCLHNTAGDNCEVCQEGYYGNAIEKSCNKCNCSVLGTNFTKGNCDGITGQCPCFNNVMGINCDQCTENHWRIALGTGCDPCECDSVGSLSPQCNPYIGKCDCKPGHGGRQCDQCQENFWGNPNVECHECECNLYGSVSQQCMRENGSCICRQGIGGYNCDTCARGYLGEAPNCYACGECFDNWDRLITDLRIQTEFAIANASKIKVVGATGAYTRDFDEMTKKLSDVENILLSAKQGQTTLRDLLANITTLQEQLAVADKKVKESNDNLNDITSKINLGNVTLDGLRNSIENLKLKTVDLGNNATKLQEANLEGALNLTREAKQRATKASDEAEGVQTIIANTDRQIKNTDRLIELQYTHFNNTQNENEKKLDDIEIQLSTLDSRLPKLNEKMCGQEIDNCDICGGAGCGKCGGISCDQGAVTKAEQALDFANKTEHRIKEHELTAEDLFRSISQVKQDTIAVRTKAKDLLNRANDFKSSSERITNESVDLTAELKEFLSNTSNTPADVRILANEILNLSIRIEPKEITELSQRINSTVSQLTNIENIITETKPDLERAKALKQNATAVNRAANLTLEMANKVLEALDEAQAAQDAAENAINKANSDIEAAKGDLVPIAQETEQAQKKANETKDEVEGLRLRLSDLQKDILKIESDAEQVKQEANDVVNRAEGAELKARQLRQDFKQTNMSLAERASQTSNSRERAQLLLNRATKLASETQMQLKQLANMEELYNDHNAQLNTLEKEIGELNNLMNYYLSEITKRSDYYRSCTT